MSTTEAMEVYATGLEFPEGPVIDRDGRVFVCEIKARRITEITGGVNRTRLETDGGPNGAAIGPDGRLWICDNGRFSWREAEGFNVAGPQDADYRGGRILAADLATGEVEVVYEASDGRPLRGPNDLVFDGEGGMYFSDHGKWRERDLDYGAVHYAHADGSGCHEMAFPLITTNGIGLSPQRDVLYAAETETSRLLAWDISAPGRVSDQFGRGPANSRLHYASPTWQRFDSLAVEENGNICVGSLDSGGITVVDPAGSLVEFVPVPVWDRYVTNIAFGGEDGRDAYITSSGRGIVYRTRWARPGLALAHSVLR